MAGGGGGGGGERISMKQRNNYGSTRQRVSLEKTHLSVV